MNQYIKRKEILNREICKGIECQDCPFAEGPECGLRKYILHTAPSVDIAEPKHGKWMHEELIPNSITGHMHGECSICHKVRIIDNFCPNCGADMRGDEE